ncbi:MAG TPA: metallophosphoesterase [Thermomicrobiales bacterium]|jgi:hypothetical protein
MRTIVIGDIHGDATGLANILEATGAVEGGTRVPETRVIQLGDLIHGGTPRGAMRYGVNDHEALLLGLHYCDTILIGNHELPHVWPDAGFPTFGGQQPIAPKIRAALLAAYDAGQVTSATSVGDWLLTHAGLHPEFMGEGDSPAKSWAHSLRDAFRRQLLTDRPFYHFKWVGPRRGGPDKHGGIFWCDWRELTAPGVISPIPQIVGHSPQEAGYAQHFNLWCVDAGAALSGRVAALVSDDDGGTWTPIIAGAAHE